jgi:hypothetical protein
MSGNAIIGALSVVLGLDSAAFEAGLARAVKSANDNGVNIGRGFKAGVKDLERTLEGSASKLGLFGTALSKMGPIGLGVGAAIGGAAEAFHLLMENAERAVDAAAGIAKLGKETGTTTDFIQQFNFAARQNEIDVGVADQALKNLNESLGAVQKNLPRARQLAVTFGQALGLKPDQLRQFKDVSELLPVIADRIKGAGSAAEQAAIARKLGIEELLPMLKDGAEGFEALTKKARDLGIVMDASTIAKAEESKKKLNEISDVMQTKANVTFAQFAGTLVAIKEAFLAAETAGLRFLSKISGTQPLGDKVSELTAKQLHLQGEIARGVPNPFLKGALLRTTSQLQGAQRALTLQDLVAAADARNAGGSNKVTPPIVSDKKGHSNALASDAAVAEAQKAELQARIALTADIAQVAALKLQEIDQERDAANTRLTKEAAEKKITAKAAELAIAANTKAAGEKAALVRLEAEAEADKALLADKQAIDRYLSQKAAIEADATRSAAARGAIELADLRQRQRLETQALRDEVAAKVARHAKYESTGKILLASQAEAQAAEVAAQERRTEAAVQAEINAKAEAALQLQIDLLQSQADAADTDGQRRGIQLKILELEQQLERLKLEEIVNSATATDAEKAIARARLGVLGAIQKNELRATVGGFLDNFNRAKDAVGGLADAFKSHDWGRVASSLVSTIQGLQVAFGPNGTLGSKIGAAAGVGDAIGQSVGGVAGSTISGIAGGASLGFTFGGPIGAGIGAVIGGIAGFFSGSSAAKKQKAAEAQQKAEEAAQHAAQVAAEKTQLQIQLLEAEGKAEEALAARREAAIAAVSAENRDLEIQLLDLQDAAEKAAQAAAVAAQGHDLQIKLLELTGDATGALAAKRADELAQLDASNRGLQLEIYNLQDYASAQDDAAKATEANAQQVTEAQAALTAARDAEAQALQDTVQKYQQYADSLKAYADTLVSSGAPTAGSYASAQALFNSTSALAQLGNGDALGSLQGAGQAFEAAAKARAGSAVDLARDQAKIRIGVLAAAGTAQRSASLAQQQLDSLKDEVDATLGVKTAVLSVADAIKNLQDAQAGQAAAFSQALAEALARYVPAEGSNITPLAPLPAFNAGAGATPTALTADSAVDPALIDASSSSGDLAGALQQQNQMLGAIAMSTGVSALILKQFNWFGMPDVREAA